MRLGYHKDTDSLYIEPTHKLKKIGKIPKYSIGVYVDA